MTARVGSIARGRFYYGWLIVAIGFTIHFVITTINSHGLSLFLKPMADELGWTRAMVSSVQSVGTVVYGLTSPFVGSIIDKRGTRGLMIFGAILVGAALIAMGFVRGLWDFYLLRGVVFSLGVGCAGALTVNIAVSNWFVRKRGKAMSMSSIGAAGGVMALIPAIAYLIANHGWRIVWIVLGIAVWVIIIPSVALFMKRRPEDIGLLPDGDGFMDSGAGPSRKDRPSRVPSGRAVLPERDGTRSGPLSPLVEEAWTRAEAIRTPALWLTILAFGFSAAAASAFALHYFSFVSDLGLTTGAAALAVSTHAAFAACAQILWGVIVDRFPVRYCGVVVFAAYAFAMMATALLALWPSFWLIYLMSAILGFAMGGSPIVQEVLWASYYGRRYLGSVRSFALPFTIVFSAGGPVFAGWVFDNLHSYQFVWGGFGLLTALGAILIYHARPPKRVLKFPELL